jgi:hypothetical protein
MPVLKCIICGKHPGPHFPAQRRTNDIIVKVNNMEQEQIRYGASEEEIQQWAEKCKGDGQ